MANFKTHVSFSTATGVVYGTGIWLLGIPAPTCALAGGMCALAGMLPDIDSKSSRSLQECLYLAAGLGTMLLIGRLREFPINDEIVLFLGGLNFLLLRFGLGAVVRRWTVHRGLLHSVPAALIAGGIAFLLSSGPTSFRAIKAVGLILGFLSHLLLDEIYSVDVRGVRLKKSFGTALKFFDVKKPERTFFTYMILFGIAYVLFCEPSWSESLKKKTENFSSFGTQALVHYSERVYDGNPESELWDLGFAWFWYGDPMMAEYLYAQNASGEVGDEDEYRDEYDEEEKDENSQKEISREGGYSRTERLASVTQGVKPFFSSRTSQANMKHAPEEDVSVTNSPLPSPARSATRLFFSRGSPSPAPNAPKSNEPEREFDPYEIPDAQRPRRSLLSF